MKHPSPSPAPVAPHLLASIWRPDDAAECLAIPRALSLRLWEFVPEYRDFAIEDVGPADVVGVNTLSVFWSRLTPDEQTTLNTAFAAYEAWCRDPG